jgi:predicted Rossmann-fold nucleotide-binding protein
LLLGTEYWRPVQSMLRHLALAHTIDAKDLDLLLITDQVGAALDHIRLRAIEPSGLRARAARPFRWLGERGASARA